MTQLPLLLAALTAATPWALLVPTEAFTEVQPREQMSQDQARPAWVWLEPVSANERVMFRTSFDLEDEVEVAAMLTASCDNVMMVIVNDQTVANHSSWNRVLATDVSGSLVVGTNTIEIRGTNEGGPAGLALRLAIGKETVLVTDGTWDAASPENARAGIWSKADVLGMVGDQDLPWTGEVGLQNFGILSEEATRPRTQQVRAAPGLHLQGGFEAELLYEVPRKIQGSWVSLTTDDRGRLYASDQAGAGIYRITPASLGDPDAVTTVERVDAGVSGAQGLCWAFDSLYANVYGQGLWRIRDTDGDDRLDSATKIVNQSKSGGEHGVHAVIPTEDGKGLYFIGGNHTDVPDFDRSRAPSNWDEDLLLPRLWDANGHAVGMMAPAGWIARCDPDGTNVEILSNGYRNQYDIALNQDGEIFTYDADMEYDTGLPWYRPTRVCHATSGSEFGWRGGTGKWPPYYEDSLPPVIEIGPGSPTGIVFGTGARFPARYQRALFILDWTYGTIYAIHTEEKGSTYVATKEDFAWAKPLPVTDTIVGTDGALYFTVGGRGTESALYRIVYRGEESTDPVQPESPSDLAGTDDARKLRRQLEAFHGRIDPRAVDAAWPHLDSTDRFVRFAARIAIENQPVESWRQRALQEARSQALVTAMVALARQGSPDDLPEVLARLGTLDWNALDESVQLGALRACSLAFIRLGVPEGELRSAVLEAIEPLYPAASSALNAELVPLLVALDSPDVVAKGIAFMRQEQTTELPPWADLIQRNDGYGGPIAKMLANMPPLEDIQVALSLRTATAGWTLPLRKEYFQFFPVAAQHPGGASYSGFLENIRLDAIDTLEPAEERALAGLLGQPLIAKLDFEVTPPTGPGRDWTVEDVMAVVDSGLSGRSFDHGQNLYHAISCSACHRFDGAGGAIGPDLSTVANKFSMGDLVEAIVEPSKIISDQYGAHVVADGNGQIAEGIMVEEEGEIVVYPRDPAADPVVFLASEVTGIKEAELSQMPVGLLNTLNPDELKDLVAYLMSGGNKNAEVFK
ncbi:Cytochrome c [Planctomycetes bacterium Poly30]|uniref:Cytochrome c n=1 Tax=Saltatorellus ferox TaxID=2528018 RepID=A0A518EQ01_9BACT|nr:Cytochrome c [Planctomycetes bacterium Poly30]